MTEPSFRQKAEEGGHLIRWGDPPPKRGARITERIDAQVEQLKLHPKRWGMVHSGNSESRAKEYRKRGCLVTSRTNEETGLVDIWACWPEEGT